MNLNIQNIFVWTLEILFIEIINRLTILIFA